MKTTKDVLAEFGETYLAVLQLLDDVEEAQWQPGKTPQPREDTNERALGMVSDPTASIVADGRRLQLRAAVIEAENTVTKATAALSAAHRHLQDTTTKWQG